MSATETAVKGRPILFKGEMVRAILDGRKTQTRRLVRFPVLDRNGTGCEIAGCEINSMLRQEREQGAGSFICPHGQPGDRLWVKETFQLWDHSINEIEVAYKCGWPEASKILTVESKPRGIHNRTTAGKKPWKPSIFMRKDYARLWLEITAVRVERLQDISETDALAEGVTIKPSAAIASGVCNGTPGPAQFEYYALWESINGKGSWAANPWVWCISFRRI